MRCLGRTNSFIRCKNLTRFLVCKKHRYQLFILIIITIPSIILTFSTLYKEYIRPKIFWEKATNIEITINEDSEREQLYYDILTDNESSSETAYLSKENIINPTLEKIIHYHENNQSEKAIPIIEKVFKTEIKSRDEYLGYIVASYSLSQQFDKAAETVLIRNKNRKLWDYSLKLDLAQCIRYYSLLNTINDGLDLVDSFLTTFTNITT
jgi:heat shock protein HspQ